MSDIQAELIQIGDYFQTATNIRPLVKGHGKTYGGPAEYRASVVGEDPETGAQVSVAHYDFAYEKKSEAEKRAKELFRFLTAKSSSGPRHMKSIDVFGHELQISDRGDLSVSRPKVDTKSPGDYGAGPLGDGTFRMVPSGDIVNFEERTRRLARRGR